MIIVTHRKPHLDEVVAAWLLKTFDPAFRDAGFEFVPYRPTGGQPPTGPQYVSIGIGHGKFDEHNQQAGHSATQLVYRDLLHRGLIPNDRFEDKALEWLVEYSHQEDTAHWRVTDPVLRSFMLPAILRGYALLNPDDPSPVMMTKGLDLIEAVVAQLDELAKFLVDWDRRVEFVSRWGKAVGVHSSFRSADAFAYHHGFVLCAQTDPRKPYGNFRARADSQVDLTPVYEQLQAQEPGAWYLHQTKRVLLSNVDPATGRQPTRMTLEQLIELVT
ncbi:MAG: hypothetical protein HYY50_01740 [Candidatus Kerfeldbacteria bacterium]|nr:hypothetical protein [Candidatus Kerfeldbacteria bacterium]